MLFAKFSGGQKTVFLPQNKAARAGRPRGFIAKRKVLMKNQML